jgi:hypothetical protein
MEFGEDPETRFENLKQKEMEPKSSTMQVIIPLFRMHTQNFDNVLAGIKEKDAATRVEGRTNHILWMAGNLVNSRYWLADVLGLPNKDPHENLFVMAKALDPAASYPDLKTLHKEWHTISPLVYEKLLSVTDDMLNEAYPMGMETDYLVENKRNMIAMGLDRESYLLGQLGLMRRIFGYEAMKYDTNKDIQY